MGAERKINEHGHRIKRTKDCLFFQTIIKNQLKNY
jgi:hypothetical protein